MTNVYVTSTLGMGSIPTDPTPSTVVAATLPVPFVWDDVIQVKWQTTDTEILLASLSTAMSVRSTPTTASTISPSSSAAQTAGHSSSASRSTYAGAVAGGVVGGVVFLALIGFFIFLRKRRQAKWPVQATVDSGSKQTHELSTANEVSELPPDSVGVPLYELEGKVEKPHDQETQEERQI